MLKEKPKNITRSLSITILLIAGASLLFSFFNIQQAPVILLEFLEKNQLICLLLIFAGALLLFRDRNEKKWYPAAKLLLSLLLISIPFFGLNLYSGNYISHVHVESDHNIRIYFGMTGLALLLLFSNKNKNLVIFSQFIIIAVCIAATLSILSYVYNVKEVNKLTAFAYFAPATAVSLIVLSVRILLLRRNEGLMTIFSGQLAGNYLIRTLLPAAIIVPAVLGRLRLWGFWQGFYNHEFGVAIYALSLIIILITILWYTARHINKRDLQRIEMEMSLQQREKELQTIFKNAPDAIVVINKEGKITRWNEAAEKIFGFTSAEAIGKLMSETIVPEEYRAAHKAGVNDYILTGNSRILGRTIEMPAITKDNRRMEIAMRIAPYTLEDEVYFVGFLRDITDIKIEEKKRRQAEQQFHGLFENAPDASIISDEAGLIRYANQQATELFGFSNKELTGQPVSMLLPINMLFPVDPGNSDSENADLSLTGRNGNSSVVELEASKKNGEPIPVEVSFSPFNSEEGILFSAAIRDITERKKTEAKLKIFNEELSRQVKEKTAQMNEILERLTDGFIALDKDFRFTYVNKKAGEMARRDPQEVLGKYVWDIFPDGIGNDTYKAFHAAMQTQLYTVNVDYYAPLDIHLENYIYPSPNGLSIFVRNVSSKKKTERALQHSMDKYKTFVDEAQDAILVYSPSKGRYIDVNKKACELLGYDMNEMLHLTPNDLLFEDDDVPSVLPALAAGLAIRVERRLKRKDGTAVEVETSASKLPDGTFLAFTRNITDRKRTEKELLRLTTELRDLTNHLQNIREEERIHIAREIHDELGQQMTVMKMDMTWIKRNLLKSEPEKLQDRIEEVIDMVDRTVKTIRKIASQLRPSLLDDVGLAAAMEWHLTEFGERTGIKTNSSFSETDTFIEDKVKTNLFRILQEALTNVARHSKATEVNVLFQVNEKELFLKIEDNGIGFDMEHSKRKTLGLLGMKERSNTMGGDYRLTSAVGKGTTVTVSFPREIKKTNNAE